MLEAGPRVGGMLRMLTPSASSTTSTHQSHSQAKAMVTPAPHSPTSSATVTLIECDSPPEIQHRMSSPPTISQYHSYSDHDKDDHKDPSIETLNISLNETSTVITNADYDILSSSDDDLG